MSKSTPFRGRKSALRVKWRCKEGRGLVRSRRSGVPGNEGAHGCQLTTWIFFGPRWVGLRDEFAHPRSVGEHKVGKRDQTILVCLMWLGVLNAAGRIGAIGKP